MFTSARADPTTGGAAGPTTNRDIARVFDEQASTYYDALGRWRTYVRRRRRESLRPSLAGRVLDVGCGNGDLILGACDLDTIGLDLSLPMLVSARARHPGVRLVQADADHLPFAPGSLDTVLCSQTIYLLRGDPADFVEEARRVLVPGGALVIASNTALFFAASRWLERGLRAVGIRHREPPVVPRSERCLSQLLREKGFDPVRSHRFMLVPLPGFAWLDRTPLGRLGYGFVLEGRKA